MLRFFEVVSAALASDKAEIGKVQQVELANRLRCAQTAVSAYLAGRSLPPAPRLAHYAAVLKVDEDALAACIAADRKLGYTKLAKLAAAHSRRRTVSA